MMSKEFRRQSDSTNGLLNKQNELVDKINQLVKILEEKDIEKSTMKSHEVGSTESNIFKITEKI